MKPVNFDGVNVNYTKPAGWTDEECGVLPTKRIPLKGDRDIDINISCWELSEEELQEINKTGKIWLTIVGGQPPVSLEVFKPELV